MRFSPQLHVTSFCLLLLPATMHCHADDQQHTAKPNSRQIQNSSLGGTAQGEAASLRFSFSNAEWPEVLKWIAGAAGLTLDITDKPIGEFNYIDTREHTIPQAIDVLNGYLLPRGYVLLRRHQFLVVLKTDSELLPNLIPTVPASSLNDYGDNELLRVVMTVEGAELQEVADQLKAILGSQGTASAVDASEALVLQGFGKNLREAVAVLASAVVPPADDQLVFRAFPLQFVPATDAERQIQNLFGLGSNPFRTAMLRRASSGDRRESRDNDGENKERQTGPTPLMQNMALNMKVSALHHTNSLLVTATPAAIVLVESILESIDIQSPLGEAAAFINDGPTLRVYTLQNADEENVAETIDAVIPGIVINQDDRHDSVHVLGTPAEHREVEKLIEIIDAGGAGEGVEVIPLLQNDPYTMCQTLSALFENEDRDDRPVITIGVRSPSLIVRASSSQMAEIRKTLSAFGEGNDAAQSTRRVRKVALENVADAERLARLVEQLLGDDSQFSNPIRVIVPSEPTTTRSRDEPKSSSQQRSNLVPRNSPKGIPISGMHPVKETRYTSTPASSATRQESSGSEASNKFDSQPVPRVTIEVRGSEVIIYSSDVVALDYVEETILELVRLMPSRKDWTVFYLRAAPADGTAQTLVDLLNNDSQPTPIIGSGAEPTWGTLGPRPMRIVPDARTNALFVSGPQQQVEQAERFLRYLDTTDLPESLRDRIPRAIPVEFANASVIAQMIRDLYKDFMEDPNARIRDSRRGEREGGDDTQEAERLVTATSSQNPGLRPSGIQMTLAVDTQANTLLVSCNDQLFEQVRQLVEERDHAASESHTIIEVLRADDPLLRALWRK